MKKTFRIFGALLLVFAMMLSVCSCGKYRAVTPTAEEKETVMTWSEELYATYDLYRFVFLMNREALDNGDASYWDSADKQAAFAELDAKAKEEIARIYALFDKCLAYGIDPYSRAVEKQIKQQMKNAIDGTEDYQGYGDRKTYLATIRENNMNDHVFRLYLRYTVCEELLAAAILEKGDMPTDWEDVLPYYTGDETVRVAWIYLPYANEYPSEMIRDIVAEAAVADDAEFIRLSIEHSLQIDKDAEAGYYIGRYQMDDYYQALTDTCFSLAVGETSGRVDAGDGVYIVRRLEKDMTYLENEDNRDSLIENCRLNAFYQMLEEHKAHMLETAAYTDFYRALTFDAIQMP